MLKEALVFERRVLGVWNTVLRRSRCFPAGLVSSAELCFVWWTNMWTKGRHFYTLSVCKTEEKKRGHECVALCPGVARPGWVRRSNKLICLVYNCTVQIGRKESELCRWLIVVHMAMFWGSHKRVCWRLILLRIHTVEVGKQLPVSYRCVSTRRLELSVLHLVFAHGRF